MVPCSYISVQGANDKTTSASEPSWMMAPQGTLRVDDGVSGSLRRGVPEMIIIPIPPRSPHARGLRLSARLG
jgi:hypothetical protein